MKVIGKMIGDKLFIQNSTIIEYLKSEFSDSIKRGTNKLEAEVYQKLLRIFEKFEKDSLTKKSN